MSTYCTQADLQDVIADLRLAELTAESGTTADAAIVTKAITAASGLIDRYLCGRYAVPVTDTTALSVLLPTCTSIVKFRLYDRRNVKTEGNPAQAEYDEAIAWLKSVADGDLSLPPTTTEAVTPTVDVDDDEATFGCEDPVFQNGGLF